MWTEFQRWALSLPVPALELGSLENASDYVLLARWDLLSMEIGSGSDAALASTLILCGVLDSLDTEPAPPSAVSNRRGPSSGGIFTG